MVARMACHTDTSAKSASAIPSWKSYALVAERVYLLSVLFMLWNLGRILLTALPADWPSRAFLAAAWVVYAFVYCMPLYLILLAAGALLGRASSTSRLRAAIYCIVAMTAMCVTQMLLYADSWVHAIFGFHLNGFVLNLLLTPGGVTSMDMSESSALGFAVRLLLLALVQAAILALAMRSSLLRNLHSRVLRGWKPRLGLSAFVLLLAIGQAFAYGFARVTWYRPTLEAAEAVPFYLPVSFNHLVRQWGVANQRSRHGPRR